MRLHIWIYIRLNVGIHMTTNVAIIMLRMSQLLRRMCTRKFSSVPFFPGNIVFFRISGYPRLFQIHFFLIFMFFLKFLGTLIFFGCPVFSRYHDFPVFPGTPEFSNVPCFSLGPLAQIPYEFMCFLSMRPRFHMNSYSLEAFGADSI